MSDPVVVPRRSWTKRTTALLVVCAVIAGLAVAAAVWLPMHARDAVRRDADATLNTFLDATVRAGDTWREVASPLLTSAVPYGSPLLGDPLTADALALDADYEVGALRFTGEDPQQSDVAKATVTVRYDYEIGDQAGTASVPQVVWLTRAFYYGDDEPRRADPSRTPSAIGPWRVTGITLPTKSDLDGATPRSRFALASEDRTADDIACYSPAKALVQLADSARVDGTLRSSCFLGAEDGSDAVAEGVDTAALLEAFPAIDETDPQSIPPELTRIEADTFHGMRAPFTQYLIADRFVLTFAAVVTEDDASATRLVHIGAVGEKQ